MTWVVVWVVTVVVSVTAGAVYRNQIAAFLRIPGYAKIQPPKE